MNFNLLPSRSFTFPGCFHYLSDVKPCGKTNNEQKKGGQRQIVKEKGGQRQIVKEKGEEETDC